MRIRLCNIRKGFTAEEAEEATVCEGDAVQVLTCIDKDWIFVKHSNGTSGYIPRDCIDPTEIYSVTVRNPVDSPYFNLQPVETDTSFAYSSDPFNISIESTVSDNHTKFLIQFENNTVERTAKDIRSLRKLLVNQFPIISIPKLIQSKNPDEKVLFYQMFFMQVADHPLLRNSSLFTNFAATKMNWDSIVNSIKKTQAKPIDFLVTKRDPTLQHHRMLSFVFQQIQDHDESLKLLFKSIKKQFNSGAMKYSDCIMSFAKSIDPLELRHFGLASVLEDQSAKVIFNYLRRFRDCISHTSDVISGIPPMLNSIIVSIEQQAEMKKYFDIVHKNYMKCHEEHLNKSAAKNSQSRDIKATSEAYAKMNDEVAEAKANDDSMTGIYLAELQYQRVSNSNNFIQNAVFGFDTISTSFSTLANEWGSIADELDSISIEEL